MQARLIESFEIAPEVRHFVFEAEGTPSLAFAPGQFVSLQGMVNGKKVTRAYSICSPPDGNRFELCLNRLEFGIFSPYLFDMKPGDAVEMRPPLGMFVLKNPPREAVFVATGTGVAPFRSMLMASLGTRPFTLLFGTRYERTLLYGSEFKRMAERNSQFRFWPTLSRPEPGWTGRTGHVQKHLAEAISDRRGLDVYICGLKVMVDDVRNMLKEMSFDKKQIVFEKYD